MTGDAHMNVIAPVPDADLSSPLPADLSPKSVRRRRRVLDFWSGRLGLAGMAVIIFIVLFGGFLAPYSSTAIVSTPYASPNSQHWLGADDIGRDVLSRVLTGGWRLLAIAFIATFISYVISISLGLIAAYLRGRPDALIMRALDVLLAFPPLLLILVLVAGKGQGVLTIFIGAVIVAIPGAARVVRSAALEVVTMPYIDAARLRGERLTALLWREILPNIRSAIIADAGSRLSWTIMLIAGLNYLGIGTNPPNADWGAMIYENSGGMAIQPWGVVAPAALIVLVVISAGLLGEAYVRTRSQYQAGPSNA